MTSGEIIWANSYTEKFYSTLNFSFLVKEAWTWYYILYFCNGLVFTSFWSLPYNHKLIFQILLFLLISELIFPFINRYTNRYANVVRQL